MPLNGITSEAAAALTRRPHSPTPSASATTIRPESDRDLLAGDLVGLQLEVEMLRATGWGLSEPDGAPPCVTPPVGGGRVDILRRCDFDHVSMTMSVVVRMADGALRCYCKGAPEMVAPRCTKGSLPADCAEVAAAHALQGYYVIALASKAPGRLPVQGPT